MWRLTTNRGQQVWKFLPTPDGKREQLPHYDPNGPNPVRNHNSLQQQWIYPRVEMQTIQECGMRVECMVQAPPVCLCRLCRANSTQTLLPLSLPLSLSSLFRMLATRFIASCSAVLI